MTVEQQLPDLPGYRDVTLVSGGSSSLVFRAVQSRLSRTVAIKVLLIDGDTTTHEQYERELETTVLLSSQPHIVSIIDTGVTPTGNPYIVMDYCPGGSYAQILRQRGPLPVDEVLDLGAKIADALQAAHDVGVIHRDVKPSNILRSAFGPALTDFGIARAPHQLTGTVSLDRMTPYHASPEAMRKDNQSPASDIYSLASTMWHLLAGRPPFADPGRPIDLDELRRRVLHEPAPPIDRPDVPAWLQHELGRALAKDPAARHPDAHTFAEVLRYQAYRQREAAGPAPGPGPGPGQGPGMQGPGSAMRGPVSPAAPGFPAVPGPPVAPRDAFRWPASAPTRRSEFDAPAAPADPVPPEEAAASTILWMAGRPGSQPPAGGQPEVDPARPAAPGPDGAAGSPPATAQGPAGHEGPAAQGPAAHAPDVQSRAAQSPAAQETPPAALTMPTIAGPALAPPTPPTPADAPRYPISQPSGPPYQPPGSTPPYGPAGQASAPPYGPVVPTSTPPYAPVSAPPPTTGPVSTPPAQGGPAYPGIPSSGPPYPMGWAQHGPGGPPVSDRSTPLMRDEPAWASGGPNRRGLSRRTWVLVAVAAVLVAVLAAVGIVIGLRPSGSPVANSSTPASPSPAVTGTLTETNEGAPTDVRLVDKGSSVTLTWTDPTDASVQFAVLGGPRGAQPTLQRLLDPGTTTLTLQGLNAANDYCYIVMAIYGTDRYARAPQVCTHRAG